MKPVTTCLLILLLLVAVTLLVVDLKRGHAGEPLYIGCFNASYIKNYIEYYKIKESLSFEQGLTNCNKRLTRYMGLQKDTSLTTSNIVYCGNDLVETSTKVDNDLCSPCHEDGNTCGGPYTMAVYKLRDETPLAILLATGRGVEMFVGSGTTLLVNQTSSSTYNFVDYIYTEDKVVSIFDGNLTNSVYNCSTMKYSTQPVPLQDISKLLSLGVDFKSKVLFLGDDRKRSIYMYEDFSTKTIETVLETIPRQFCIDPYNRILFFLDGNKICLFNMHTNDVTYLMKTDFNNSKSLAIDFQKQLLYGIVTCRNNTWHLVSWNYTTNNISNMRVLFNGPELATLTDRPYTSGFDVFSGTVVWIKESTEDKTNYIYKCTLTPECNREHLSVIYQSPLTRLQRKT